MKKIAFGLIAFVFLSLFSACSTLSSDMLTGYWSKDISFSKDVIYLSDDGHYAIYSPDGEAGSVNKYRTRGEKVILLDAEGKQLLSFNYKDEKLIDSDGVSYTKSEMNPFIQADFLPEGRYSHGETGYLEFLDDGEVNSVDKYGATFSGSYVVKDDVVEVTIGQVLSVFNVVNENLLKEQSSGDEYIKAVQ